MRSARSFISAMRSRTTETPSSRRSRTRSIVPAPVLKNVVPCSKALSGLSADWPRYCWLNQMSISPARRQRRPGDASEVVGHAEDADAGGGELREVVGDIGPHPSGRPAPRVVGIPGVRLQRIGQHRQAVGRVLHAWRSFQHASSARVEHRARRRQRSELRDVVLGGPPTERLVDGGGEHARPSGRVRSRSAFRPGPRRGGRARPRSVRGRSRRCPPAARWVPAGHSPG